MSFYVQHGYGKGDKVTEVVREGSDVLGVILSPGDEDRNALDATASQINDSSIESLLDPQSYVYSIPGASARCHDDNDLAFTNLAWHLGPTEVQAHVSAVCRRNRELATAAVLSPTPLQSGFEDAWSALSLSYARATIDSADRPVLVSLVVSDSAFSDWQPIANWLDVLTTLDVQGFYLLIAHQGGTYPLTWSAPRLANVLRTIYVLGALNEYEVIWGYSDIAGIAGVAAGGSGFASGWFHSLRFMNPQKWVPQRGGRQANPRVMSTGLLSSLDVTWDGAGIAAAPSGATAIPDGNVRTAVIGGALDRRSAWVQHMVALSEAAQVVSTSDHPGDRLDALGDAVDAALELVDELENEGVYVDRAHAARLRVLRGALDQLVAEESL